MKPLLLAPLLLAISGCSSDIVVKTDLGEKTIVKKTTVYTSKTFRVKDNLRLINGSPAAWDYRIKQIEKNIKKWESKYSNCLENKKENWCNNVQRYPLLIKTNRDKAAKYKSLKNDALNRIKELAPKYKNFNPEEIIYIEVKYTPIFENINRKKIVQSEVKLKCWNKSIDFSSLAGETKSYKRTLNPLESKICKKYAKFE